ncbi:hypothetical protein [Bacillus rubiinfantis]|uniref:hypothetical protein n=1 Tax=Bacillus rubiinfantis TaxID=1499680 RepID=UPI0005AAB35E|nr:hypothetical protein [Bacillus rubiinfantis]
MFTVKKITIKNSVNRIQFGTIAIDDVTGMLNIGSSYETNVSSLLQKKLKEKLGIEIAEQPPLRNT